MLSTGINLDFGIPAVRSKFRAQPFDCLQRCIVIFLAQPKYSRASVHWAARCGLSARSVTSATPYIEAVARIRSAWRAAALMA